MSLELSVKVLNPHANQVGGLSSDPVQNSGTINPTLALAPLPLGVGLTYLPSALPDAVAALTAVRCRAHHPLPLNYPTTYHLTTLRYTPTFTSILAPDLA